MPETIADRVERIMREQNVTQRQALPIAIRQANFERRRRADLATPEGNKE